MGRPIITELQIRRSTLVSLHHKIRRRRVLGYTDVPVSVLALEQILELAEKGMWADENR